MIYKRFLSLLLTVNMLCLLTMTSCAAAEIPADDNDHHINAVTPQTQQSNILIAYFSRMGNTDFPDDIDAVTSASLLKSGEELYGNTQYIATLIQKHTGGDLFLIQTEEKYPSVYEQIDEQGGEENRNRIRPKLAAHVDNMDDYSIVFLGYPIWYYDLPMAVYSFLEEYDLSGKTIIPFVTSGASGFTGTLSTIQELQPNASVRTGGFDVKHSRVAEVTQEDVSKWIDNIADFQVPTPFSDVPADAWYADAVAYCRQYSIMSGTSDTTFAPEETLTRAMLATVLYRMSGSPSVTTPPAFADEVAGAWYSDAVSWASANGVISGYGNGTFGVNDPATREQAVAILWRYAGSPESGKSTNLSDMTAISDWAQKAVHWADTSGFLEGMTENRQFVPKTNIQRGEIASMLYHFLSNNSSQSKSADSTSNRAVFDFETKSVVLNSGYTMPINGLGTYSLHGETCVNAVKSALASGVRLIDTASAYGNEEEVGQAIREAIVEMGIQREDIFVVTKIYPGNEMANPEQSIQACLDRLDIDYVDMMLLHHPDRNDVKAYQAMEKFIEAGKIRSIGLSNWYVKELESFLPEVNITPALVQNEIHPYYQENDVIPYIQDLGIVVQGWYPLGGRGHTAELLSDEVIAGIAKAHHVSSAQVILRWNLQKGVVVIPGSSNPDHIKENTELYGFTLTDEEMARINALDRGEKHDWY